MHRAVLVADAGRTYFALLRQITARPDLEADILPLTGFGLLPAALSLDRPVPERRGMAVAAERAGFLLHAAHLYLSLGDIDEARALSGRHPDDADLTWLLASGGLDRISLTPFASAAPLAAPSTSDLPADLAAGPGELHTVLRATLLGPRQNWLPIHVNQSGRSAAAAAVARELLSDIGAGRVDPRADLADIWVAAYRRLARRDPALDATLRGFDTAGLPSFTEGDGTLGVIAGLMARQTGAAWLTDDDSSPAAMPAGFPAGIDWSPFAAALTDLRAGRGADIADAGLRAYAAWVLFDAGRRAEAEALAGTLDPAVALEVLTGFAAALDADCEAALFHPGAAYTLGGRPLYDFSPC